MLVSPAGHATGHSDFVLQPQCAQLAPALPAPSGVLRHYELTAILTKPSRLNVDLSPCSRQTSRCQGSRGLSMNLPLRMRMSQLVPHMPGSFLCLPGSFLWNARPARTQRVRWK